MMCSIIKIFLIALNFLLFQQKPLNQGNEPPFAVGWNCSDINIWSFKLWNISVEGCGYQTPCLIKRDTLFSVRVIVQAIKKINFFTVNMKIKHGIKIYQIALSNSSPCITDIDFCPLLTGEVRTIPIEFFIGKHTPKGYFLPIITFSDNYMDNLLCLQIPIKIV